MTNLKSTINNNLKADLFSLNQLVKYSTKGDGKKYIATYIAKKDISIKEITVASLLSVMNDNDKFTRVLKNGKFQLTKTPKTKFSLWSILTLIDRLSKKI